MKPVAVSGMFRSGTTLLWRILAADETFTRLLCEPFHPELPKNVERLPHYAPFAEVPDALRLWSRRFNTKWLRLVADDDCPAIDRYLAALAAEGALLKFVRGCLRLDWFLDRVPGATVVNIVRDPRAVCYSFLKGRPQPIDSTRIAWTQWHAKQYFGIYAKIPEWREYLRGLAREAPYVKIIALWRVNVEQSMRDLEAAGPDRHVTVTYERLVSDPAEVLARIYRVLGREMPDAVLANAQGTATEDLGGQKKWQSPTSVEWAREWRKVDDETWARALERTGAIEVMRGLGYDV